MASPSPPLCINCRYTSPATNFRCEHPTSLVTPERSLVTGDLPPPYQLSAEVARFSMREGMCGRFGRYHEPKSGGSV